LRFFPFGFLLVPTTGGFAAERWEMGECGKGRRVRDRKGSEVKLRKGRSYQCNVERRGNEERTYVECFDT
jgi:hypothetical protein